MGNPRHLALARQGRDAWNQWRQEYPDEPADFSEVDFTTPENQDICFVGFDFGDGANFSHTKFGNPFNLTADNPTYVHLLIDFYYKPAKEVLETLYSNVSLRGATFIGATFGEGTSFEGAVFDVLASFEDATFGALTNFSHATFVGAARFDNATFLPSSVSFHCTTFQSDVRFVGATFGALATFDNALFMHTLDCDDAIFGHNLRFVGAMFGERTFFNRATFGAEAHFDGAIFGEQAHFEGTKFGNGTYFNSAIFGKWTNFEGATFGYDARFYGTTFGDIPYFDHATFGEEAHFDAQNTEELKRYLEKHVWSRIDVPEERRKQLMETWEAMAHNAAGFGKISFRGVRFRGGVHFVGRHFSGEADFTQARFDQPPDFRSTKGHDNFNWANVHFGFRGLVRPLAFLPFWQWTREFAIPTPGWTTNADIGVKIRRLRRIATDIMALDAERNLLILQRMAERGVLWKYDWLRPWRPLVPTVLMSLYRLFSNCGRRMLLPLIWMFASNTGIYFFYKLHIVSGPPTENISDALWTFTLANAVPFGGVPQQSLQKATDILFGPGALPPPWVQITSTVQGIFGALLLFLLLLAIRNYFRFKV